MTEPEWYTKAKAEGRILSETGIDRGLLGTTPRADKEPRPNKYGNQKTVVDGITFDSRKEANRYMELKLMAEVGAIRNLKFRKQDCKFTVKVRGIIVCRYYADFVYEEPDIGNVWTEVIEDVKSAHTRKEPYYRLKKRLVEAALNITIREV